MRTIALLSLFVVAACSSPPPPFPLPAYDAAVRIGPQPGTDMWPRIFLTTRVDEAAIAELAPYCGVRMNITGRATEESCAREGVVRVIEDRPDAVLVSASRPQVTGVTNTFFVTPWVPGITTFSSADVSTDAVAYGMRAMPVTLPFKYSPTTGMVMDVAIREAVTGGLLEGDTMTVLDGAPAIPPKDWPTWTYYTRMLQHSPGATIDVEWIRPGVGKMKGTATLQPPKAPHLRVPDSIDVRRMPFTEEREKEGRTIWRMYRWPWDNEESWAPPRVRPTPAQ